MRVPLITEIDSRDGTANKDERLTNVLAEIDEGVSLAVLRPGLAAVSTASGNGNGMTNFNDVLISVFGATLGSGTTPSTVATVTNGACDFAASPL